MTGATDNDRVEPLLALRDVSRTFNGSVMVPALRPCSFDVAGGEMVAIVGRSGSGKSTLLNVLGLLDRPTTGSYRIHGVETTALDDRHRTELRSQTIGFVFQSFHLIDYRSTVENVEVGMMYQGIDADRRRQRAVEALKTVGLSHRINARPETMSGGERQRTIVARALATDTPLLLCDEPTGNLDSATSAQLVDLLVRLNREQGTTVVVITHDDEVAGRCGRILEIVDGFVSEGLVSGAPVGDGADPHRRSAAPVAIR